jgi:hypothetical protein
LRLILKFYKCVIGKIKKENIRAITNERKFTYLGLNFIILKFKSNYKLFAETINEEPWNSSTHSSEEFEGEEERDGDRAEANEAGHVIALPEGCILTKKDFEELLAFQRKDHVDVWYETQITRRSLPCGVLPREFFGQAHS